MINIEETVKGAWNDSINKTEEDILAKYKKLNTVNKTKRAVGITLFSMLIVTIYAFLSFDYKQIVLSDAISATMLNFGRMFTQSHFSHFTLKEGLSQLAFTMGIAFLATISGAILAFVFGLLAAQNLSAKKISIVIRGIVSFIRAVPTVLWVLIFAVSAGLGSTAAVVGMTFHSFGYLLKAYSESFEEIDIGVIEALKGSGANWWQIVFQAVVPSSATYLLSWTFIRFEINFVEAVAVGAAAGAGGIGFELFMASGHYFDLREVGSITYLILAIALLLEFISIKTKLKLKEA